MIVGAATGVLRASCAARLGVLGVAASGMYMILPSVSVSVSESVDGVGGGGWCRSRASWRRRIGPGFLAQAIAYYLRQTHPSSELIIVD